MAPILAPYVVVACGQPTAPDIKVQKPSTAIPRFTAWQGGGGT